MCTVEEAACELQEKHEEEEHWWGRGLPLFSLGNLFPLEYGRLAVACATSATELQVKNWEDVRKKEKQVLENRSNSPNSTPGQNNSG